jgi:hypothetical protein
VTGRDMSGLCCQATIRALPAAAVPSTSARFALPIAPAPSFRANIHQARGLRGKNLVKNGRAAGNRAGWPCPDGSEALRGRGQGSSFPSSLPGPVQRGQVLGLFPPFSLGSPLHRTNPLFRLTGITTFLTHPTGRFPGLRAGQMEAQVPGAAQRSHRTPC